jgi:hypothetical protein
MANDSSASTDADHKHKLVRRLAKTFNITWVELAQVLIDIRKDELWKLWKFTTFNSFCIDELKLDPKYVETIMERYDVLVHRRPDVLAKPPEERVLPQLKAVDTVMKAAKANNADGAPKIDRETFDKISADLLKSDNRPLAKKLSEFKVAIATASGKPVEPATTEPKKTNVVPRKLVEQVEKLVQQIEGISDLPSALREHAAALVAGLKAIEQKQTAA